MKNKFLLILYVGLSFQVLQSSVSYSSLSPVKTEGRIPWRNMVIGGCLCSGLYLVKNQKIYGMEDAFVVGAVGGVIIPYFYKAADLLNATFSTVEESLRSSKKISSEIVNTLGNVYWDRSAFRNLRIYSFSKIS